MTALFDIMVAITNGKCLFSFDVAAPSQITRKTTLAATIMSTPVNRNVTHSAPYTSPRAARKIVLSRNPISARSTRIVQISHSGSAPVAEFKSGSSLLPGLTSPTTRITRSAA